MRLDLAPQLPADPALPRLRQALDEDTMAVVFAEAVAARGLRVEHCRVERVKYRPGRNCTLSYRLELHDAVRDAHFEQRVSARLCAPDEAERRRASAATLSWSPSDAGPGLRTLPALDMVTWWWPNDAKLAAPRLLSSAALLRAQLLPGLAEVLGVPAGAELSPTVSIAQYVPEQRLTARVDLRWDERHGGRVREQRRTVFAKASREPDGATAHGYLCQLQASAAWQSGRLCTPAPLLWQPGWQLHWQAGVPGVALLDLAPAVAAAMAGPLGTQLAALHATPVHTERQLAPATLDARLLEVVDVLARALPGAQPDLLVASQRLGLRLGSLCTGPASTLHGDLHPRNVLVDGSRLSLIDLDGLRRGPAVLELGAWIADGIYRAVLDGAPPMRDREAWQALLDAYGAAGGVVPPEATLCRATAWNLLTQRAWRCVVNLKPGRFAIAPRLVALAARLTEHERLELA